MNNLKVTSKNEKLLLTLEGYNPDSIKNYTGDKLVFIVIGFLFILIGINAILNGQFSFLLSPTSYSLPF